MSFETASVRTLEKQRSQTLGPLIASAKKQKAIPDCLIDRFDSFLKERNWLIHKCVVSEYLSLRAEETKYKVFLRIGSFAEEAVVLQNEIFSLFKKWHVGEGYDLNEAYSIAEASLKAAERT